MPALEIPQDKVDEENIKQSVTVPEVRNLSVKEALETLKEAGLEGIINEEQKIDEETTLVKEQLPKPGLKITQGTRRGIKFLDKIVPIKNLFY